MFFDYILNDKIISHVEQPFLKPNWVSDVLCSFVSCKRFKTIQGTSLLRFDPIESARQFTTFNTNQDLGIAICQIRESNIVKKRKRFLLELYLTPSGGTLSVPKDLLFLNVLLHHLP